MLYFLCIVWIILTVATASWWLYLGLQLTKNYIGHDYRFMFMSEGVVFVALLLLGGFGLIWAIRKSNEKTNALAEFLTSFSHETKTAMANLRLQVGILLETSDPDLISKSIRRLDQQCTRIQTQLENALILADGESSSLFIEPTSMDVTLSRLQDSWSQISIKYTDLGFLPLDVRAIECIFSNLFQNSIKHGLANEIEVRRFEESDRDVLEIKDNGKGYDGPVDRLGKMFFRYGPTGGNGIGLHLVRTLSKRMSASVQFETGKNGFTTRLYFVGANK